MQLWTTPCFVKWFFCLVLIQVVACDENLLIASLNFSQRLSWPTTFLWKISTVKTSISYRQMQDLSSWLSHLRILDVLISFPPCRLSSWNMNGHFKTTGHHSLRRWRRMSVKLAWNEKWAVRSHRGSLTPSTTASWFILPRFKDSKTCHSHPRLSFLNDSYTLMWNKCSEGTYKLPI